MSSSPHMRTYKTKLLQTSELGVDDIIIAFMGQTGSGKSQIIDTLTGQPGQRATESPTSVTQNPEAIRVLDHERYGSRIVLVETPGFNHSSKTDEEILKLIREWLEKTHEGGILLSGIVYVHRITDLMSSTLHRNLLMFAKLAGLRSAKNVVLATTMWDILGLESDAGRKREKALKVECWDVMIPHGAAVKRFVNTADSAWSIVDNIVNKHDQKATPLAQEEQPLKKTGSGAGTALYLGFDRLIQKDLLSRTELKGALRSIMPRISKQHSEILKATRPNFPSAHKPHTDLPVEVNSPPILNNSQVGSSEQHSSASRAPPPMTVTSNHGNKPRDANPVAFPVVQVATPIVHIDESTLSIADKSTKLSTTPPLGFSPPVMVKKDVSLEDLAVGVSAEQRRGTLSNDPTKRPPVAVGTQDELSILSTNGTNDKPGHASQPSSPSLRLECESLTSQNRVDESDHLETRNPIPSNIPQEEQKLASKIFSESTSFGSQNSKPKAKGEGETRTPSEAPHTEEKQMKSEQLREDVVIAVMGPTGSGKSTFINVATGVNAAGVGHDLESCTREIGIVKMTLPDYNIVFVDTPGFDDTERSDSEILNMISDWLKITCERRVLLGGLLYFHRISDNRMGRTPLENLRMFEELCGQNGFKNVILTTTMWDEVDEETGANLEEELKRIYWKSMIDRHSGTGRFEGTRESAFRLIAPLLGAANSTLLLLQKERRDLDLRLSEMNECQKLCSEIKQVAKQQQELLHQIREELKRPNCASSLQSLMEEYEELKRASDSLFQQVLFLSK